MVDKSLVTLLPIQALLTPLREAFKSHNQVILEAPTGAGKSTALPLDMLDWPEITGKILMLEPRRVAARNVAQFVAKQRGCQLGTEVGYRVKGDSKVSQQTRLEIVTEGVLTRMIQHDPELTGIDMVIFDEIHERHLTTDLGLALALEIQAGFREDLKILAMSATLSGLPLTDVMPEAQLLKSEGRSFPVEHSYSSVSNQSHWLEHMAKVIVDSLNLHPDGSLLAFLPGQAEINRLHSMLNARLDSQQFMLCPLYGSLSAKAQDQAIAAAPQGMRKVVLATNVAESSLTIEGITQVVDSGYKRQASFNPKTGVTRLSLKRISQASAAQRAGRAGRLMAGFCTRLWSQEEHGRLPKADEPEILHTDLLSMVLDGAFWGVKSLAELPMLTAPSAANEQVSWQLLQTMGMVNESRLITPHGREAHQLGCNPRLAHMLLMAKQVAAESSDVSFAALGCILAGTLESRSRSRQGADISRYLQESLQGEAQKQIRNWSHTLELSALGRVDLAQVAREASRDDIAILLAYAYPDRIAKARGVTGYQLANGSGVELPAEDALAGASWLVVADFQETAGRSQGRVYLAAALDPELFSKQLVTLVETVEQGGWDDNKGRFFAETQQKVGQIILGQSPIQKIDQGLIKQAIEQQIRIKGLSLMNFNDACQQLQYRVALARQYCPDYDWPALDNQSLLDSLSDWLTPYLDEVRSLTQLQQLDCYTLLLNLLPWELQQQLDSLLPKKWPMATGSNVSIEYDAGGRALLSVRLQEALGMQQSPVLAQGKLVVTMELLSPAHRPLAVTADLASFWQGPYEHVKKEMKGRYPKHLWPDDPANTQPTKFTKKKTFSSQ
ncbi:ATP-dependent helicase HrpB [Shewanella fidelis]|uniref:ATP-dependent helicase HrpB n=1 Tax=Shewanella fidelis TaxID=173509 RepID=A0AAW8NRC1_9GAMM|nr:ATP-dependent helicase HrpB [Shewanella fidelis]MDR8525126.1 ATP-dependent helicase HrpB [Shewanella fidelis]MDW4811197.1 ATP-dependent helicase HrpB [Shewanella fidelis]MDW4815024.1 ATP-dependent helicase HrpB [Shewanella fidelis]MDW4819114.1 ATP-dependent helicase HrpB [Shewanella fidelis]MDW4823208.1 ATP-dependent helicase HrpB [Shewanella fidelis]